MQYKLTSCVFFFCHIQVYLYDTRKSRDYVDKLLGLNEVVLDVIWNSSKPELAASALNNCVTIYSEL